MGVVVGIGCDRYVCGFGLHVSFFCREVTVEEGQLLASNWECPFVECSAKDNENISRWRRFYVVCVCFLCWLRLL